MTIQKHNRYCTLPWSDILSDWIMTWGPHITKKWKTLNHRLRLLNSLLWKQSRLKLRQNLNTYTYLPKLIWRYRCRYGPKRLISINSKWFEQKHSGQLRRYLDTSAIELYILIFTWWQPTTYKDTLRMIWPQQLYQGTFVEGWREAGWGTS